VFTEAFLRPGLAADRWASRANYAALNIHPTGPAEMSLWHGKSGQRYTLRTDGFVSAHAGAARGECLSHVLTFTGDELLLNVSTSAAGGVRVEIQEASGSALPGFSLAECDEIVGDAIDHRVTWKKQVPLRSLAGRPVRLRWVLQEADLYAFQFREGEL